MAFGTMNLNRLIYYNLVNLNNPSRVIDRVRESERYFQNHRYLRYIFWANKIIDIAYITS